MNRRDLLLTVLAAAGGRHYTPVQLQKAVFSISRNMPAAVTDGPGFAFAPYDYGPFDASVYHEADRLNAVGQAEIGAANGGRWRTYAASADGLEAGQLLLAQLSPDQRNYVAAVSEWVRKLSFASLVKSIYEAYPEMRANSIFQG